MSAAAAEQQSIAADKETKWECKICEKTFQSEYILNYHKLLEHSQFKRPPIGVG
jgi:hypothetical protein